MIKYIQWGKESFFNKWCWKNWAAACKRMKLNHFFIPCSKINSKKIKDFYVSPKPIKLLNKNVGCKIFCIHLGTFFGSAFLSKGNKCKNKCKLLHQTKMKSFCTEKKKKSTEKKQATKLENTFAKNIS